MGNSLQAPDSISKKGNSIQRKASLELINRENREAKLRQENFLEKAIAANEKRTEFQIKDPLTQSTFATPLQNSNNRIPWGLSQSQPNLLAKTQSQLFQIKKMPFVPDKNFLKGIAKKSKASFAEEMTDN